MSGMDTQKVDGTFDKFIDDLKNPVTAISLVLAILSIVVSVYLYYAGLKAPNPAYLISEDRSQIFDSTISSPNIRVLDKDGTPIEDDIYLATVTFWNAGHLAIEKHDINEPVRLHISPIKQILDYSIIEQTQEKAANFQVFTVTDPSENSEDAEIELSWDYLRPDFAVKIQVIYIGYKEAEISFRGYIDGTTGFSNGIESDGIGINTINFVYYYSMLVFAIMFIALSFKGYYNRSNKNFVLFFISTYCVLLIVYFYFLLRRYGLISLTPPI
ncbi:MAG: hypothetical protein ACPGWR_07145 [Ardenticatenaceae bacterium]